MVQKYLNEMFFYFNTKTYCLFIISPVILHRLLHIIIAQMNTYTKTLNIIDYTIMGLLAIGVILTALNIPYARIGFMILWCLSVGVFMATSIGSKLYKISVPLFVLDLFCKINLFSGIKFWNIDSDRNYIGIGMALIFVIYLIDAIMTKKAPIYRPLSYLLIYAVTAGVCAAIRM